MAKRITKREKRIYDAEAWKAALKDSRVVRYNGGMTLSSFPTRAAAEAFFIETLPNDPSAEIVKVKES